MTILELRDIAATQGIHHALLCLEQHTTHIGRDAAEPLWLEMASIVTDHADASDGLDNLPDVEVVE
jgi:hypothetical protein